MENVKLCAFDVDLQVVGTGDVAAESKVVKRPSPYRERFPDHMEVFASESLHHGWVVRNSEAASGDSGTYSVSGPVTPPTANGRTLKSRQRESPACDSRCASAASGSKQTMPEAQAIASISSSAPPRAPMSRMQGERDSIMRPIGRFATASLVIWVFPYSRSSTHPGADLQALTDSTGDKHTS